MRALFLCFQFYLSMSSLSLKLFIIISSFIVVVHSVPLQDKSETDTDELVAKCNNVLDSANVFSDCSSLIASNWNCINSAPASNGHPEYHRLMMSCGDDQEGPLFCCPVWALLRCILVQVKVHCTSKESSEDDFSQRYQGIAFQPQIDQLQTSRCAHFPFSSPQCDKVLTFIRDKFALENEAKKSGLYPFFFPNTSSNQNKVAHLRSYKSSTSSSSRVPTLNYIILIIISVILIAIVIWIIYCLSTWQLRSPV